MSHNFDPSARDVNGRPKRYLPAQYFSNLSSALSYVGKDIMEYGIESNPRGMGTRELLGRTFIVTNTKRRVVDTPARNINIFFLYGELIWYMKGVDDVHHVAHYNKRMKTFSDDGDTLRSAYGRRLLGFDKSMYEFNQMQYVIRMLMEDPSSRKAIMHIRTVEDSMFYKSKDMPCTIALQYFIREGELIAMTTMRSNDLIFGASYDIPFFMFMQDRIAWNLGVKSGMYYHQAMSLHVYEMHYDMVNAMYDEALTQNMSLKSMEIPEICDWGAPTMEEVFRTEEMCRYSNNIHELKDVVIHIHETIFDLGWRHALQCCLLNTVGRILETDSFSIKYEEDYINLISEVVMRQETGIRSLSLKRLLAMAEKGSSDTIKEFLRAHQELQI